MFTAARKAARNCQSQGGSASIPLQCLPELYSFSQLHHDLVGDGTLSKTESLENILVLASCLEQPSRLVREEHDNDSVNKIVLWISKTILPDGSIISKDDIASDSQTAAASRRAKIARDLGLHGLTCLKALMILHSSPCGLPSREIFLSAIAFTSSRDTWSSPSCAIIAASILLGHADEIRAPEFIIEFLLKTVIRPLFSKSKPPSITATGRKAMSSSDRPRNYNMSDSFDPALKPWKYLSPFSITVFEWAVENASEETVAESWNLFIPPLVTLLDDPNTPVRSRGLSMLSLFLPKMSGKRLKQTGLGDVFEDAVMPTLMFLPGVTPVEESMELLEPAYNALFVLADVRWESEGVAEIQRKSADQQERRKFYDRIMRQGILTGFTHAHEHRRIVELLTKEIGYLVEKMGMHAVKHLKNILQILSYALTDPFHSSLPLSLATIGTMKAVILACWPRISDPLHRRLILKSIVLCWKNLEDVSTDGSKVKDELKSLARLFTVACEASTPADTNSKIETEVSAVVGADPHLLELFNN